MLLENLLMPRKIKQSFQVIVLVQTQCTHLTRLETPCHHVRKQFLISTTKIASLMHRRLAECSPRRACPKRIQTGLGEAEEDNGEG